MLGGHPPGRHPLRGRDIEPIRQQMRAKAGPLWSARHLGVARQLVVSGAWTQDRLYAIGRASTPQCLACGEATGTAHHRYHVCSALHGYRMTAPPELREWQHVAETHPQSLLWSRALMRHPASDWRFVPVQREVQWDGPGDLGVFTGTVCCDGSKLGHTEHAQVGWAAAQVDDQGQVGVAAMGLMPVALPEQRKVKRVEMWAFFEVIRHALPPIIVHTDHAGILSGLARGRDWCTAACRAHADVWRLIWRVIDDLGGLQQGIFEVWHCKAHRSKAAIARLAAPAQAVARGNAQVDVLAKVAAELDAGHGREAALREATLKVRWMLRYVGWWHAQTEVWPDVEPRRPQEAPDPAVRRPPPPPPPARPHTLRLITAGTWRCTECGRWASSVGGNRRLRRVECPGVTRLPAAGASGRYVSVQGHAVMRTGPMFWCLHCGCHAEARVVGLRARCTRRPVSVGPWRRLLAGKHPATGQWLGGEARRVTIAERRAWARRAGPAVVALPALEVEVQAAEQAAVARLLGGRGQARPALEPALHVL